MWPWRSGVQVPSVTPSHPVVCSSRRLGIAHGVTIAVVDETVPPNLTYCSGEEAGISRRRAGRAFAYSFRGKKVTDAATLARIKRLAVPPAWTDVWIAPHADCHIQATGRDAKGRKQYRYHPAWTAWRDEVKYDGLIDFGEALPRIRRRLSDDLALRGLPREKVLATVVHLLETTLVRVGNEEYAKTNGSFGLTTLRSRHVKIDGGELRLAFVAKSGKPQSVRVYDRQMARIVRQLHDMPGQRLFKYQDGDEIRFVESTDVNSYLREITNRNYTAKEFRTWMGTLLAATALAEREAPSSDRAARRDAAQAIEAVATKLNNTRAVCKRSYVHPAIIDMFVEGELQEIWAAGPSRDGRWLLKEERKLLAVLREARKRAARERKAQTRALKEAA
ncbi:MAG: DNA topoisomerase IB [Actinobacteria bacterium]|nr:DNA topoisomerase IB [Actinomycetota bacterium]